MLKTYIGTRLYPSDVWNGLRDTDRALLCRAAKRNGGAIVMLDNPDKRTWDNLTQPERDALLAIDWNKTFEAA